VEIEAAIQTPDMFGKLQMIVQHVCVNCITSIQTCISVTPPDELQQAYLGDLR
jgi:hypothetical protein